MDAMRQLNHEHAFEQAWADPSNTPFEWPPVDVNRVLADHYRLGEPLTFTRTMLWDVEVRKAWRPDRYIPTVVQEGSARTWGGHSTDGGNDLFVRASRQRLWLAPEEYGLVLEQGYLDFAQQKITCIGAAELLGPDGEMLRASTRQPLFHVEHSVGGDEARPLNQWRIVHLTDGPDSRLVERFTRMADAVWLPEFIEIYLRSDLNRKLTRRTAATSPVRQ